MWMMSALHCPRYSVRAVSADNIYTKCIHHYYYSIQEYFDN